LIEKKRHAKKKSRLARAEFKREKHRGDGAGLEKKNNRLQTQKGNGKNPKKGRKVLPGTLAEKNKF